jgi:hypothetical protein
MKKTSIYLDIILKSLGFFEKASLKKKPQFYLKCLQKGLLSLKKPQISYWSLYFYANVFKKPRNIYESLTFLNKKASNLQRQKKVLNYYFEVLKIFIFRFWKN